MNRTILIVLFACLGFVWNPSAQTESKAVLVDEFGQIPCDELYARTNVLESKVTTEVGSRALVKLYPQKTGTSFINGTRYMILSSFQFMKLENQLEFVIANEDSGPKVEFWIIPAGANESEIEGTRWVEPPPNITKPFIFGYEDENGECPTFVPRKFGELLKANPGSRAHIVFKKGGRYSAGAQGFANETTSVLIEQFNLSRKRIRVFYTKGNRGLSYVEYWFVPARKKS